MTTQLNLATCSYRDYHTGMGVPIGTSIGRNKQMPEAVDLNALKPWTTFRKMSDRPPEEQRARYQQQLTETEERVAHSLQAIQQHYPGIRLMLLCWCHLPRVGADGCHRRWAADWLEQRGMACPELGSTPDTRARQLADDYRLF